MNFNSFFAYFTYALFLPFLIVGMILAHYLVVRFFWRRGKRKGKRRLGFYPSALALGMWFQSIQAIYQPSVAYVLEEKQDEDADQDADADPATPESRLKFFHRQLQRIRRGDPIDRLVLRI